MTCDPDISKNATFTDFNEMVESKEFEKVDSVAILTPNNFHVQMAGACVEYGKNVLVEKPLGLSSKEIAVLPDDGKDEKDRVPIHKGEVRCRAFPFVVLTSNGERDFPPPFLRRCLRLNIPQPSPTKLEKIVEAHLPSASLTPEQRDLQGKLIKNFLTRRGEKDDLATDQLLNALYLSLSGTELRGDGKSRLLDALWKYLSSWESS